MRNSGRVAIKAIAVMGLLAFALLWAGSLALRKSVSPNEAERVAQRSTQSPFEGGRAMATLGQLVDKAGDPVELITGRLRSAGFQVQRVGLDTPAGRLTHVVAHREGVLPGNLLLATPYTPRQPGMPGANSAASGAALLLELARVLPRDWTQHALWMLFLDGINTDEAGAGKAAMVSLLANDAAAPWKAQPTAALYLSGVGDRYLGFARDGEAPEFLVNPLWETAARFLLNPHFYRTSAVIPGPAAAMRAQGIPAAAFADTTYGGSYVMHQRLWHTPGDTTERVCAESLQAVGDVLYHSIPAIDGYLNGKQRTR